MRCRDNSESARLKTWCGFGERLIWRLKRGEFFADYTRARARGRNVVDREKEKEGLGGEREGIFEGLRNVRERDTQRGIQE